MPNPSEDRAILREESDVSLQKHLLYSAALNELRLLMIRARSPSRSAWSVATDQSAVDREWKGRVADSYANSIGNQKEAAKAVQSSLTNPIVSALVPIATGIITFWVTIGTLVLGLVTCIAEAANWVGLPAVPASALVAFRAAIASIVGGIAVLAGTVYSAENSFQNVANEVAAFGPTPWPKAFE